MTKIHRTCLGKWKAIIFLCLFSIVFGSQTARAAEFYSPQHDVRIALDWLPYKEAMARFYKARYGGHINLSNLGCGRPQIFLDITEIPTLTLNSWASFYDGRYGANVDFSTAIYGHVEGGGLCRPNAQVNAKMQACLGTLKGMKKISLHGVFSLIRLFHWPFDADIPLPIELSEGITIELKPAQLPPPDSLNFEYGHWEGETWKSDGSKKTIPVHFNIGGLPEKKTDDVGHSPREARYLVIDGTVGETQRLKMFPAAEDAKNDFEKDFPIWEGANLGISLASSFFGQSGETIKNGILGELLPIRIWGSKKYRFLFWKGIAHFELFLDGAQVRITEYESKPVFDISFSISSPRVWKEKKGVKAEKGKPIKKVNVQLLIRPPQINEKGEIIFKVEKFTVYLKFYFCIIPIRVSPKLLENSLNNGKLKLGDVQPEFELKLPDCVNTNESNITPSRPCNGIPGNPGYMSHDTVWKNSTFMIPLNQLKSRTVDDQWHLGLKIEKK